MKKVQSRLSERRSRVTMRDIAEVTGFTMNTVSRALKDKDDISYSTKKLINNAAKKLGYIPDAIAISLRSGKSKTISVIIPDISDPLFAILVRDIETKLKEKRLDLFIQNTDEDNDYERRCILAAISKKIDGIIICPCQKNLENINILKKNKIPFVLLGRRCAGRDTDYVVADDTKGGYLATRHLIEQGHRRILFLNGPRYISSAKERLMGYKKALRDSNIEYRDELVRELKIKGGDCSRILKKLLKEKIQFTSIFCFSDLMAWEAISYLQTQEIRIPPDVAIVGFDDIQSMLYYPYPLTSVAYGKKEMAMKCIDILYEKINNPYCERYHQIVVDVDLVIRKST